MNRHRVPRARRRNPVLARRARGAALALLLGVASLPALAFDERAPVRPAAPDSTARPPATSRGPAAGPVGPEDRPKKPVAWGLVRIASNVHVHADEVVRGDVLLIGGRLRVDGWIDGGAVVLGGDIDVGPEARIAGEAIAVGGRVQAAAGSEVRGTVSLTKFSTPFLQRFGRTRVRESGELVGDLAKLAILILIALVVGRFAAAPLAAAQRTFATAAVRCVGLGLFALPAGAFAVVVVAFLLALSLVGLPIALLLLAATAITGFVSLLVGASWLGARVTAIARRRGSPSRHLALGLFVLHLPELASDGLRILQPDFRFAFGAEALSVGLQSALLMGGLGALVLRRWSDAAVRPVERVLVPMR